MKQLTMPLIALSALALMAGCPDDETTPTSDTVADTNTNDTTDTNGGETTPDTTPDTEEDTTPATGYCMNAQDLAVPRSEAQSAASDCGLGCVGEDDERQCTIDCMLQGNAQVTPVNLTEACAGCYGDIVLCSIDNCIPACLTPDSEACQTCQGENCVPAFYACTGFETVCDDTVDNNNDGNTDCDDPSCAEDSACANP